MTLNRIRLELARCPEFPNGSAQRGFEFVAPLTGDGHLDTEEWRKHKDACRVHRFWVAEPDQIGRLVHGRGGWSFHYDGEDFDEDEPVYKLDRHTVREGEYLSIMEADEELRTFRVVRVQPLSQTSK